MKISLVSLLVCAGVVLFTAQESNATSRAPLPTPAKVYNLAHIISTDGAGCGTTTGTHTVNCSDIGDLCIGIVEKSSVGDPFDYFEKPCDGLPVLVESGTHLIAYGTQSG